MFPYLPSNILLPIAGLRVYLVVSPHGLIFRAGQEIVITCEVITPGKFTFRYLDYCVSNGMEKTVYNSSVSSGRYGRIILSTIDYCRTIHACRAWDDAGSTVEDRLILKVTGQLVKIYFSNVHTLLHT